MTAKSCSTILSVTWEQEYVSPTAGDEKNKMKGCETLSDPAEVPGQCKGVYSAWIIQDDFFNLG